MNEGPQETQGEEAPQPQQQEVQQPSFDPDLAYQIIAQQHGITPEAARDAFAIRGESERVYHEYRRKLQDLETRQPEPSQRYGYQEPQYDEPVPRWAQEIVETNRAMRREREEELKTKREQEQLQRDLDIGFRGLSVRVPGLDDQKKQKVVDALLQIYPDQNVLRSVGVMQALDVAARYAGVVGNYAPGPQIMGRGPTAQRIIPQATTMTNQMPSDDGGPQRADETLEDYVMRRRKFREQNTLAVSMRDGVKYTSE